MVIFNSLIHFEFFIKCLISAIFGGAIGLEREIRHKPAGIKTHLLISLGATAITFLSMQFPNSEDPARIAAQIVSGIGFIGAGTILQSRRIVQGLTTAATLWVTAAVGMLVGAGFYIQAGIVTGIILPFLIISQFFSKAKKEIEVYSITVEIIKMNALEVIEDMLRKFNIRVEHKSLVKNKHVHLEIEYRTNPLTQHLFLKKLFQLKGVGEIIRI
ncbi:MgtC/SapB family protein [Thermoproteota archaeon]